LFLERKEFLEPPFKYKQVYFHFFDTFVEMENDKSTEPFSLKKRLKSFGFAFRGIARAVRDEHNLRIHLVVAVLVILTGLWLDLSIAEWLFVVFAIGFVLTAEFFNSALERLTDMVQPDSDPGAGLIKDMAAGAVLVAAITAAIIGLFIFIPRLINLL